MNFSFKVVQENEITKLEFEFVNYIEFHGYQISVKLLSLINTKRKYFLINI